jgi:hypothetical protein
MKKILMLIIVGICLLKANTIEDDVQNIFIKNMVEKYYISNDRKDALFIQMDLATVKDMEKTFKELLNYLKKSNKINYLYVEFFYFDNYFTSIILNLQKSYNLKDIKFFNFKKSEEELFYDLFYYGFYLNNFELENNSVNLYLTYEGKVEDYLNNLVAALIFTIQNIAEDKINQYNFNIKIGNNIYKFSFTFDELLALLKNNFSQEVFINRILGKDNKEIILIDTEQDLQIDEHKFLCDKREIFYKRLQKSNRLLNKAIKNNEKNLQEYYNNYNNAKSDFEWFVNKYPNLNCDKKEKKNNSKNQLYKKFVDSYKKVTKLLSEGKGNTNEAIKAYEEYKKAKKAYEESLKEKR